MSNTTQQVGIVDEARVARARAKLRAAQERIKGCTQARYASACARTGDETGRAECYEKAEMYGAFAAKSSAQADLIEAEAGC